jgi:large subunit ribosomal protein L10
MDRNEKADSIVEIKGVFDKSDVVLLTHYRGLTVREISDLRSKMHSEGARLKVTKNKLAKIALKDSKYKEISELFSGPTAIAYSDDPTSISKLLVNFSKENDKLVLLGGIINGQKIAVDNIRELASLPSLDELRAKLIALINRPASKLIQILNAPAQSLSNVVSANSKKEKND